MLRNEHLSSFLFISKNIGKIYANTNIEEKYLTVISGNRKVVEYIGDGKNIKTKNKGLGKDTNGEITVEEVKKLNEMLYSENYLYKDIKEKVIGKTMLYYPALKDVIKEVICGNEKSKGIIQEGQYKEYLLKCINDIVSAFTETENRNLRIIRSWIFSFRKIYEATTKYYSSSKYYEEILNDFLRYSIWVTGAIKKNKKITCSTNYGSQDMVYFEGHEYTHIFRYSFIDAWINRDVWSDEDLSQACKSIIKRREQEDVDNPPKIHSTGKALNELRDWYLMEEPRHRQLNEYFRELLHIYRKYPAMYEQDSDWNGFEWINADDADRSIYSFVRKSKNDKNSLLFVCNMTPVARDDYRVGVPKKGTYHLLLNSNEARFGGTEADKSRPASYKAVKSECDGREYSISYPLPPFGVAVFRVMQRTENHKTKQHVNQIG